VWDLCDTVYFFERDNLNYKLTSQVVVYMWEQYCILLGKQSHT